MTKPSKSTEDKAYRGLPYHDEWSQSHSAWTNNHRSFYITLQDVYKKKRFAEKLRIHKENCDSIADVYGFMTAFRYDMQIRLNAFAHRVPTKDGAAIPDISVKQMVVVEQCYSTVRSFGEASWKDNNYAPGLSHTGFDPDTGLKQPELHKSASYHANPSRDASHTQHRMNHQERRREKRWGGGYQHENYQNYPANFINNYPNNNFGGHNYGYNNQNYNSRNQFGNRSPYDYQHAHNNNNFQFNPYAQNNPDQGFGDTRKRFKGRGNQSEDTPAKNMAGKEGQGKGGHRKQ
ncbi:hypothetical protein PGTUg99_007071 [Puccinia graminis f. sp. tritici]|uniref:Uncharacterized protein n=1 Tax=Puccinia graminis f. sp. tritici TaxID=56615 RepID=A0A5B0PAW6_PUCGR|nr:hypothetical protein PGTUg99_007071 [Puccinia graminis f. sp. tritici]